MTAFRRAVEHEPLNESAHRELMTCWAQLGETARAVRHYTELTTLLRDAVGVPRRRKRRPCTSASPAEPDQPPPPQRLLSA